MQALLTQAELAQLLRIGRRTLSTWIALGRIGPEPVGPGRPRYLADEVQAWIAQGMPDRKTWLRIRPRQHRR